MKEYIERATVLNLLEKINPVDFGSMFDYEAHGAVQECLREISYGVEAISAADVAEVVRGKWEEASDGDGIVCSECRTDFCTMIHETEKFRFCPNCGARMDKEAENA